MSIISRMRRQKAVYWAPAGADDFGRMTLAPAIEIACRWEDGAFEAMDAKGEKIVARSKVYVDRDLAVGGMLLAGRLADFIDTSDPRGLDAREIKEFSGVPNLKATEFLRTALLV